VEKQPQDGGTVVVVKYSLLVLATVVVVLADQEVLEAGRARTLQIV
jgi:hypothetical protein